MFVCSWVLPTMSGHDGVRPAEIISELKSPAKPIGKRVVEMPEREETQEQKVTRLAESYFPIFEAHDTQKRGGLDQAELGQVVRVANDKFAFLDNAELEGFLASAWQEARPDAGGLVRFAGFAQWYERFMVYFNLLVEVTRAEEQKAKRKASTCSAKTSAKQSAAASGFKGDGTWDVPMPKLQDALAASWAKGRVPLLIDNTAAAAAGAGASSRLETFWSLSGHTILELGAVLAGGATLDEARAQCRAKLIASMRRGTTLVLVCAEAAPLRSKLASEDHLPWSLLADYPQVTAALADGADLRAIGWAAKLLTADDELSALHPGFGVVVVARSEGGDVPLQMREEWPVEQMQRCRVSAPTEL